MNQEDTTQCLDQWLKVFYRKIFPCELFCKWLSYGSKNAAEILSRREFSFSLAGDIYVRYKSFNDAAALRKELVMTCPHKIDIGAVYSAPPKLQRSLSAASFTPEWKELVFDIDLTDYDEIRFCCGSQNPDSKTAVCNKCWQLAKCAVVCIDRALREDFGFVDLLWVFSGRRGVHCWVCDPVARQLDAAGRTAIAEYLSIVHGADSRKSNKPSRDNFRNEPVLHPSVETAVSLLKPRFADYFVAQDFLSSRYPDRIRWVLKQLPSDLAAQRSSLDEQWTSDADNSDSTAKRWNTLKRFLKDENRTKVIKDIILNTTYPRLDAAVTTGTGHLLKSPFCAHPKTGFICVPIDPRRIDEFDPTNVPQLGDLVKQLAEASSGQTIGVGAHLLPYKMTTLRPYVEFFEQFVQSVTGIKTARDNQEDEDGGVRLQTHSSAQPSAMVV